MLHSQELLKGKMLFIYFGILHWGIHLRNQPQCLRIPKEMNTNFLEFHMIWPLSGTSFGQIKEIL